MQEENLARTRRGRDDLLVLLADELRRPLASMRDASHLLSTGRTDDEAVARARAVIERQTESMARLVDDSLDLAHIEHGEIELANDVVDLRGILARAIDAAARHGRAREIERSLPDAPLYVRGDPARLEQAFRELLQHAAKLAPAGARIAVTLDPSEPCWTTVSIGHTGSSGMTGAREQRVAPFVQVERTPEPWSDVGLGFFLAKRLLELHGGCLATRAREGTGERDLVVRIRAAPCAHAATQAVPCTRVLIVEDDVDLAESQLAILSHAGLVGRVVHDGAEAVAAAHQFLPDVVLLDIGLPGEDGYRVAERLRREADMKDTLLIALTGYGAEQDIARSHAAGIHEHVTKPADQARILRIIERWRAIKRARSARAPGLN